jgi:hypothetical protein
VEIVVQILKQLPPFWPRAAMLGVLILLLALPQSRRWMRRGRTGERRLERARSLLELRKLELEVTILRGQANSGPSQLDDAIEALLAEKPGPEHPAPAPLPWWARLRLAGLAALALWVVSLLALAATREPSAARLATVALREVVLLVPCALLASAIPTRARWGTVFYAFLIPVLVAALGVASRG